MTVAISVILNLIQNQLDSDFRQDDDSRAVIPDLIRNLRYCQKTADPVRQLADSSEPVLNLIQEWRLRDGYRDNFIRQLTNRIFLV